jgi:V8-like Glu-specific endopeptidase
MKFLILSFLLLLSNHLCIAQDTEIPFEYPFGETGQPVPRGVYGEDNRKEVNDTEGIEDFVRATAVMIPKINVRGNKIYGRSLKERLTRQFGDVSFDKSVRFLEQPTCASCTGFLIAPDILVTAGHCIDNMSDAKDYIWVFDYTNELNYYENSNYLFVDPSNVYEVDYIIGAYFDEEEGFDYSVLKLERKSSRTPYRFRTSGSIVNGSKVYTIGSPTGLPLKFADNASVTDDSPSHWFQSDIDTFPGNSGGPVFNPNGFIEGIHVRGSTIQLEDGSYAGDYKYFSNCDCVKTIQWDEDDIPYVGADEHRITSIPHVLLHQAIYENIEYAIINNLEDRLEKWIAYSWIIDHEYTINRGALQFVAAKMDNLIALQAIIENSDNQVYDKDGRNLLFYAIDNNNIEMASFLLEQGELINLEANNNITPLQYAALVDHYDLTILLINNGGEIEKRDGRGNNLLHYAASNGNFALAKELINQGLSAKVKNYDRRYPEKVARKNKHKSLGKYLKKARKRE